MRAFTAKRFGEVDRTLDRMLDFGRGVAVPGTERCGHSLQDSQLLPVPAGPCRQVADNRQRLLVQPDRLGMGKHAGCNIGCAAVVGHGSVRSPAAGILLSQPGRHQVGVVGVQQLEALGDAPVKEPPLRRADLRVCRFTKQIVREIVTLTELAHDPAPPEFVDCSHHYVGLQVAGLGEQIKGEVRAHSGRKFCPLPGSGGRLAKPAAQHSREIAPRLGHPARIDGAAHRLDDVQREPSGRRLEQVHVGVGHGSPGGSLGKTCRIRGLERAEGKLSQASRGPHPVCPVQQHGIFVGAVVAQGRGHE